MSTIGVCLTRRWIPAVAALGLCVGCTPQTFQKALGGTREDKGYSLEETQDHGYVVAGQSNSFSQAQRSIDYIVKTNASGELEWQNNAYGGDFAVAFAVVPERGAAVLLAGELRAARGRGVRHRDVAEGRNMREQGRRGDDRERERSSEDRAYTDHRWTPRPVKG